MLEQILTVPCIKPKGWLLVAAKGKKKTWIIPREAWIKLNARATKKFGEIAPLAPYPDSFPFGMIWEMNRTTYKWVEKELDKLNEKYKEKVKKYGESMERGIE